MARTKSLPARPKAKKIRTVTALMMGLGALVVVVAGLSTLVAPIRPLASPGDMGGVAVGADDVSPLPTGYDIGADEAGLSVIKEATPDPVRSGTRLTYTIRVTNTCATGVHVVITDTLPTSVTLGEAPGGTLILPDGRLGVTWTVDIATPGVWTQTVAVTVADGYKGPLTNVVQVVSDEGPRAAYTETSTAIILRPVYLPLILRNTPDITTITGEYLLVGNPCATDPCLPGLIYAVLVKDTYYYPTVEGSWLWWNRSWDGYTPEVGDIVRVTGYVSEMVDIFGDPFYDIEVVSLEPASTPPPTTSNVVITDVLAYSAGDQDPGEYVEICNDDPQPVPLEDWTLHNAANQVFTFPGYLIQPDQFCRIYTNQDHPEWCGFSFGSDSDVWNYAQDCAYLRDDKGILVDAYCYCQSHTAYMIISATTTTLGVGEAVTVTVTLFNRGCTGLGLPLYRLYVQSDESEPTLTPSHPEPVEHSLGIGSGQSDAAEFTLQAVSSGQAVLRATSSFEVHLGYPGPAYWGISSGGPLTITVTP
ncbi:MAG: lamin tail domain-containing protein [Chloroflexota bacterium]|nr:lamin tail domain-containing protein [Chloroflexota bacterium]